MYAKKHYDAKFPVKIICQDFLFNFFYPIIKIFHQNLTWTKLNLV